MSDHRAEQIMERIDLRLQPLASTGYQVHRGRVYAIDAANTPALSLYQGEDVPVDDAEQTWTHADWDLSVYVDIHVREASQWETALNRIRREVAVALLEGFSDGAAPLGLDFVHDIVEGPAREPERSAEAEKPTQMQRTEWTVRYRRSRFDPGA